MAAAGAATKMNNLQAGFCPPVNFCFCILAVTLLCYVDLG